MNGHLAKTVEIEKLMEILGCFRKEIGLDILPNYL